MDAAMNEHGGVRNGLWKDGCLVVGQERAAWVMVVLSPIGRKQQQPRGFRRQQKCRPARPPEQADDEEGGGSSEGSDR